MRFSKFFGAGNKPFPNYLFGFSRCYFARWLSRARLSSSDRRSGKAAVGSVDRGANHPAGRAASELGDKGGTPPAIVYVGFRTLFVGGHVPGATFHGSASTEQGLSDLKKWAEELPRTTNLVIYCGCCPLEKCPNIRPAFTMLDKMGFKKLRVLILPTNFATDWADKGCPIQKGM